MIKGHREGRPDAATRSRSQGCSTNMLREPHDSNLTQRKSTWDSGVSDLFGVGGNEPGYNPFGGTTTSVVTFTSPGMTGMDSLNRLEPLDIDGQMNDTTIGILC